MPRLNGKFVSKEKYEAATAVEKVEPVTEETPVPKKRGGRKASPLTAVLREFEAAKAKLVVATKRAEGVQDVLDAEKAAQERFDAAKEALDGAYGTLTS